MDMSKIAQKFPLSKVQIFKINNLNIVYLSHPIWELLAWAQAEQVYWFLNDAVFNKNYLTRFEYVLRNNYCAYYYSKERGLHYDQFEIFTKNGRCRGSAPYELQLKEIVLESQQSFQSFPFRQRVQGKAGLKGEFLSLSCGLAEAIKQCEEAVFAKNNDSESVKGYCKG
jgi:hypothetical protein